MHYEDNRLVEGDCKNIKTYSDSIVEQPVNSEKQAEQPDNSEYILKTPFPSTEVPVIFSSVYQYLFKNDKEKKYRRLLLIMLIELVIGIVCVIVGYYINLGMEEYNHNIGVRSRGASRAGTMFMYTGVAAIAHSFYSLVKYTSLFFIGKMEVQKSEQWIKLVLFFIEFFLGAIFITVAVFIDLNSSKEKDITGVLLLLGAGLVIGSVWSLSKYLIKKHKDNKN